jgi:hypothetical protein
LTGEWGQKNDFSSQRSSVAPESLANYSSGFLAGKKIVGKNVGLI